MTERNLQERVDFLERTVNKLWEEFYRLQEKHYELEKKVKEEGVEA